MKWMRRHRLAGDEGFSLTEVLTVTTMLAIVLAAAYGAVATVSNVTDNIRARSTAQEQGQIALEQMIRELRQAVQITDQDTDTDYRFKSTTPTCISFYVDLDHNKTIERSTYTLAGGLLTRSVSFSGMETPGPNDFPADSVSRMIANVDTSCTTLFTYYNGNYPPTVEPDPNAMNAVVISLRTVSRSGNTTVAVDFPPTEVQMRAFPVK
jgi:prepilin-type N-terminal cleavage/methylation domain-containing protein